MFIHWDSFTVSQSNHYLQKFGGTAEVDSFLAVMPHSVENVLGSDYVATSVELVR